LYKRVFNINGAKSGIRCAFFITDDKRRRDGVIVPKGKAVHIAGIIDDGVVMNCSAPSARVRPLTDISKWFQRDWCRCEVRGLDMSELSKIAEGGSAVYDLDKEWGQYFFNEQ
jgi:murein DD-endopeptidase